MSGSLSDLMQALQHLADAVTENKPASYRDRLVRARAAGATDEQIWDAYQRRNRIRLQGGEGNVSFTWTGRYC